MWRMFVALTGSRDEKCYLRGKLTSLDAQPQLIDLSHTGGAMDLRRPG